MNKRPWMVQIVWLMLAGLLLTGAGLVRSDLAQARRDEQVVTGDHSVSSLLEVMPGGLRSAVVAYLWIRVEELKQQGRYHEIVQISNMICALQPRFPGVWDYHAWNMAYNVSVQTHTPEERWLWVNNGVELLREKGIPLNPRSIILYRQLAWIFNHKMGDTMDEMHMVYKKKLAATFQRLLGSPPYGTAKDVIDAFRPLAEAAFIDRTRQAEPVLPGQVRLIQMDRFERLLAAEPDAAACWQRLKALGVRIEATDQNLLDLYNRWSMEDAAHAVRREPPRLTDPDKPIVEAMNDRRLSAGRNRLLAFVRAQVLWNRYRMDPQWMLKVMEQYGPIDWRLPWAHALYWTTLGVERTGGTGNANIEYLNNDRNTLNALKALTWYGRLTMIENPSNPDQPEIGLFSDVRFIDACQKEHDRLIRTRIKPHRIKEDYKDTLLADGHINYLATAVQMLFAAHQRKQARELMDFVLEYYGAKNPAWNLPLEEFVLRIFEQDGKPIPEVASSQISMALQTALLSKLTGQQEIYEESLAHAQKVREAYLKGTPARLLVFLPTLDELLNATARQLLATPRQSGYNLNLIERARLYANLHVDVQGMIYDFITPPLSRECALQGVTFEKAFPPPPNLEASREALRRRAEELQRAQQQNSGS